MFEKSDALNRGFAFGFRIGRGVELREIDSERYDVDVFFGRRVDTRFVGEEMCRSGNNGCLFEDEAFPVILAPGLGIGGVADDVLSPGADDQPGQVIVDGRDQQVGAFIRGQGAGEGGMRLTLGKS